MKFYCWTGSQAPSEVDAIDEGAAAAQYVNEHNKNRAYYDENDISGCHVVAVEHVSKYATQLTKLPKDTGPW